MKYFAAGRIYPGMCGVETRTIALPEQRLPEGGIRYQCILRPERREGK